MKTQRRFYLLLSFLLITSVVLSACGAGTSSGFPDFVARASARVQEAYQHAVDHPETLEYQPCYCGCIAMGHENNLDCFVANVNDRGEILFDPHGSGCGICVDIALDVKQLDRAGWSALDIRRSIDSKYGHFGNSTNTPLPPA